MNIAQIIAQLRGQVAAKLTNRNELATELDTLRGIESPDETQTARITEIRGLKAALDSEIDVLEAKVADALAEQARDDAADRLSREITPGAGAPGPAYDRVARVGAEERQYAPHRERGFDEKSGTFRRGAKPGAQFERDVAAAFLGDYRAQARLVRHMQEEEVERAEYVGRIDEMRAAGTGAFAGLTVPQYLTDMYAPAAAAMRPFADACNKHELPTDGMVVNLSRITTATSTALQASENSPVSETNIDDTLLTFNVQTNAGQQTLSRQAIERGTGVEPVVLDDLYRRYHTTLDSTLINQATTGLAATGSTTYVPYVSGTPKVVEYYPILVSALAAVEAAMLDQASGENIVVMHSRRWYWLQNGLSATWPLIQQPGLPAQMLGENYAEAYGKGIRGMLPSGTPVVVDNNITTAALAQAITGGTQDQTYVLDRRESHLWEDPAAPVFIRAEQPAAASLGVLLVLYGYFAYTFQRYAQAQVIAGTGCVTPAFTGV